MALPLDVLITPQTKEQLRKAILDLCAASGLRVSSWQVGGAARTLIANFAQLMAPFTDAIAFFTQAGFLDLATGSYLTLLAYYVYGVERIEPTYSAGDCTVTNTAGGLYTFEIGEFIASDSTTGTTFSNTAAFTLDPVGNPGAVQTVPMQAQVAGAAGTSSPGNIDSVVTAVIGVTVSNDNAFVGFDGETDEELRQRCRDKLGSLSPNGSKSAYAYIAKSATDSSGAPLGINRVKIDTPDGTGVVKITLATKSGALSSSALTAVTTAIKTQVVPDSVTAQVQNSVNFAQNVLCDLWIYEDAGLTDAELQTAIEGIFNDYWPTVPIGGYVLDPPPATAGVRLWRVLEAKIIGVSSRAIEAIVNPETDVAFFSTTVGTPGTLTLTVHRVAA